MVKKYYSGFTIFEIVVVLGILVALALVVLPISVKEVKSSQAKSIADQMTSYIFLQQQNAYTGKNNKSYGIAFNSDSYTVFVGNSLASAEDTLIVDYPADTTSNILLSNGATELVFLRGYIHPSQYGNI